MAFMNGQRRALVVILVLFVLNAAIYYNYRVELTLRWRTPLPAEEVDFLSLTDNVPLNYSCKNTPVDRRIFDILANPHAFTEPLMLLPPNLNGHGNSTVYELMQNQPLCIRIVIPPLPEHRKLPARGYFFPLDEPAGSAWEQIMVFAEGSLSKSVRVVDMKPWAGFWSLNSTRALGGRNGVTWAQHMDLLFQGMTREEHERIVYNPQRRVPRDAPHVYEGELRVLDLDDYSMTAMVEYYDALWNCESYPPIKYSPNPIVGTEGVVIKVVEEKTNAHGKSLSAYNFVDHVRLPVCRTSANPGRWLHTSLLHRTPVDPPLQTTNTSEIWAPFTCRLQPMTYFTFQRCLEKKYPVVHWFGDSHSRRALKTIFTGGNWCEPRSSDPNRWDNEDYEIRVANPGETKQLVCDCDDNSEPLTQRMFLLGMDGGAEMRWPGKEPTRSRVRFYKMGGLTDRDNSVLNFRYLFNPTSGGLTGEHPDLVVFNLVNWDSAFTQFHTYRAQLEEFLELVKKRYPRPTTRFIYRTAQYHCCHADASHWSRRWSSLRVETYERFTSRRVQEALGNRVEIWDVYEMGKQRRYGEKVAHAQSCASNHALARTVDLENLVLMNGLCAA